MPPSLRSALILLVATKLGGVEGGRRLQDMEQACQAASDSIGQMATLPNGDAYCVGESVNSALK